MQNSKKIMLKPKDDTTNTFSIRVGKKLLSQFDELSQQSGYSRNELINFAMEAYIESVELLDSSKDIKK